MLQVWVVRQCYFENASSHQAKLAVLGLQPSECHAASRAAGDVLYSPEQARCSRNCSSSVCFLSPAARGEEQPACDHIYFRLRRSSAC